MQAFAEGNIESSFPNTWMVTKYDDWMFYRNHFVNSCCGNKAVDFLAHNPADRTLWLIELKDYRQFRRIKSNISLWDEVAIKARDTLAGLVAAKVDGTHPNQAYASQALGASRLRVVLHLEQPRTNSKLFPRAFDPADVQQKLKQILKPIDAHPKVVEIDNMQRVPWTAISIP